MKAAGRCTPPLLLLWLAAGAAQADDGDLAERVSALEDREARVGVTPGGGGFHIETDEFRLRVLGYVQAQADAYDTRLQRDTASRDFRVRRARINFLVDFYDDYELFLELDGAPEGRTALVEARLNWRILDDAVQLRAGKFTSQFSTENARSSRSIDTIERYLALNSLFSLPALDTQFGVMAHGRLGASQQWGYSLGVYNGNSSANANVRDDNERKEVQAKLTYEWTPQLSTSVALDYSNEAQQELPLVDAGFNEFTSVPVEGRRYGVGGDVHWQAGRWDVRAEALHFRFEAPHGGDVDFSGGFVQPARFLSGSAEGGVQALLRAETARLDADTGEDGDAVHALTTGLNWFLNPNARLQLNGIATRFNGPSDGQSFGSARTTYTALTQLQFKF